MTQGASFVDVDQQDQVAQDLVQLARAAVAANNVEMTPLLRRLARRYRSSRPELADALVQLLRGSATRGAAVTAVPDPVDRDSRLSLVKQEYPVVLASEPVMQPEVQAALSQLAHEHLEPGRLAEAGLAPTRTALFTGPPGVGKTLAARWLARALDRPLFVLDLASVMSSLLGRTGENVRRVLDHAKSTPCVLLLDELDAVAKRRDDSTEIGELKRLVTVLLQEIDAWPEGSLLLAATNHPDLLDPAVWRRFETTVEFALPDHERLVGAMQEYLDGAQVAEPVLSSLGQLYLGASYSDVQRDVMTARRRAALQELPLEECLLRRSRERLSALSTAERIAIAVRLLGGGQLSQRRVAELTGVSRDTLRRRAGQSSAAMSGAPKAAQDGATEDDQDRVAEASSD
ncbi:AAA family ATPase [Modestobacter lacusdianchii]